MERSHSGHIALLLLALVAVSLHAAAQPNRYIQQGNKLYEQQNFKEAEASYARAIAKDPNNTSAFFNLGNSLYQQKRFDSSRKVMSETAKLATNKEGKAAANYNIGNTYMSQQKWEDAVNSYKQTLRNNPQDADAKYNLSYAEEMMKKQQQQNKDQKQDKKDQKDKNDQKDKKDQKDKDKKDQQDKNKDQQPQDKKDDKEDQQPQGQPSKLSQQQADQLLNALQQEEKKLQDKLKKEKGTPVRLQKDW